jgi:hypothetical protein
MVKSHKKPQNSHHNQPQKPTKRKNRCVNGRKMLYFTAIFLKAPYFLWSKAI